MDVYYVYIPAVLSASLLALVYIFYKIGERHYKEFERRRMFHVKPTWIEVMTRQAISQTRCFEKPNDYYDRFKGHRAVGFFYKSNPSVYVLDPDVLRSIMSKDWNHFSYHAPLIAEGGSELLPKAIIANKGERWRQLRKVATPAFTPSKMKTVMFDVVKKRCDRLVADIQHKCNGLKDGALSIDAMQLLVPFSVDTMTEVTMGIYEGSLEGESCIYKEVKHILDFVGCTGVNYYLAKAFPFVPRLFGIEVTPPNDTPALSSLVQQSKELMDKCSTRVKNSMHYFAEAQRIENASGDKEREITDLDITGSMLNFIASSYDGTGYAHAHLAYLLALNPSVQDRARREVEAAIEEEGGRITYEGVQRMTYLQQTVQEGFRYFPTATATERACTEDYTVAATATHPAIAFRKGDYVVIPTLGLHRDPDLYEDPDRFDPDRWSDENRHKIHPYAYMAFGAGPRECIATRYVYLEAKVLFASLLLRFTFGKTEKTPEKVRVTSNTLGIMNNKGFWVEIKPRPETDR